MTALDQTADLGEYLALLAEIDAHDARQAAEEEAVSAHLAELGATWAPEPLLSVTCTACGQTGRECGQRSYAGRYRLNGATPEPLHPELRELLGGGLGLGMTGCCLACDHDRHGHRAHDRALARARAAHRTAGADALANILTRRDDPELAAASTARGEDRV